MANNIISNPELLTDVVGGIDGKHVNSVAKKVAGTYVILVFGSFAALL